MRSVASRPRTGRGGTHGGIAHLALVPAVPRAAGVLVLVLVFLLVFALAVVGPVPVPASAQSPPDVTRPDASSTLPSPSRSPSPTTACAATWFDPAAGAAAPGPLASPGVREAWRFGDGAGQTVAVIDTGVSPHPRLPRLRGGGDLVAGGDGLEDCDAHGTLIAGLLAATPGPDGFSGIAPGVEVVSIRQSSARFSTPGDPRRTPGAGSLRTLAAAITAAASSGARIINISEVACVPAGTPLDDAPLRAAVRDAVLERDIVIVAAAGNTDGPCAAGNPAYASPLAGADPLDTVATLAVPARYDDLVLTVGSVDAEGAPADFSLPGPWVDVAAPGVGLVSLSVGAEPPGLADRVIGPSGPDTPLEGTSFSAPLVAGLAALVRERFPALTAPQVYERITGTATGGGGGDWRIGAGVVDPLAALTAPPGRLAPLADPGPVPAPGVVAATTRPLPATSLLWALLGLASLPAAAAYLLVRRTTRGGCSGRGAGPCGTNGRESV